MGTWVVIPSLLSLRGEFNTLAPNRDKGADGTIGDQNHTSSSDHTPDEDSDKLRGKDADKVNEVHALDIDSSGPWPTGRTFKQIVMDVIAGEKKKWLDPNDKCRLNYVIYDRKIYDKDNDFEPENYEGSDPHTNHAHFSARYETSCENDIRPWGVVKEWDQMATKDEVKAALREVIEKDIFPYALSRIAAAGWSPTTLLTRFDYILEAVVAGGIVDADGDGDADDSASLQGRLTRVETEQRAQGEKIDQILALLKPKQAIPPTVPPR